MIVSQRLPITAGNTKAHNEHFLNATVQMYNMLIKHSRDDVMCNFWFFTTIMKTNYGLDAVRIYYHP